MQEQLTWTYFSPFSDCMAVEHFCSLETEHLSACHRVLLLSPFSYIPGNIYLEGVHSLE